MAPFIYNLVVVFRYEKTLKCKYKGEILQSELLLWVTWKSLKKRPNPCNYAGVIVTNWLEEDRKNQCDVDIR